MKRRRDINLGATGCLCWETSTYSPDCCDPDDPKAEEIGRTRGPLTPPEPPPPPPPPEPSLGYGLLYNWYAATDVRGIAPDGWRIPSNTDWSNLITEIGGASFGSTLNSVRTVPDAHPRWNSAAGTDDYGLGFLPAGLRIDFTGLYGSFGTQNQLWSFTQLSGPPTVQYSYRTFILSSSTDIQQSNQNFNVGLPIRLMRDTPPPSPTVTDADGNTYTWVQIGAQYWLAQSLKTTKYNTGDPIPTGLDDAAWTATTEGAWAYPNGDPNLPI